MFDPNLPQENTLADAVQMRAQFNGLKTLIDAISGITGAVVDSVTTVAPASRRRRRFRSSARCCTSASRSRKGSRACKASPARKARRLPMR